MFPIMNENIQNDRMAEQVDTVENTTNDTDQEKDELKKEEEIVKSSSPVVYIALILSSFFALGLYEVRKGFKIIWNNYVVFRILIFYYFSMFII